MNLVIYERPLINISISQTDCLNNVLIYKTVTWSSLTSTYLIGMSRMIFVYFIVWFMGQLLIHSVAMLQSNLRTFAYGCPDEREFASWIIEKKDLNPPCPDKTNLSTSLIRVLVKSLIASSPMLPSFF